MGPVKTTRLSRLGISSSSHENLGMISIGMQNRSIQAGQGPHGNTASQESYLKKRKKINPVRCFAVKKQR